jgi:hypothetical protein
MPGRCAAESGSGWRREEGLAGGLPNISRRARRPGSARLGRPSAARAARAARLGSARAAQRRSVRVLASSASLRVKPQRLLMTSSSCPSLVSQSSARIVPFPGSAQPSQSFRDELDINRLWGGVLSSVFHCQFLQSPFWQCFCGLTGLRARERALRFNRDPRGGRGSRRARPSRGLPG